MKAIFQKPYFLFWSLIPAFLLISLFYGDKTIDINIHDTYFIAPLSHISLLFSSISFANGVVYFVLEKTNRKYLKTLSYFHFMSLLFFLFIFYISLFNVIEIENIPPEKYYEKAITNPHIFDEVSNFNILMIFSLILFLLGQCIIFPINFLISIFRKNTK